MKIAQLRQSLAKAIQYCQQQKWQEADKLCRQILKRYPKYADALNLRGVILLQTGQGQASLKLFRQAIAIAPKNYDYHKNLLIALQTYATPAELKKHCKQLTHSHKDNIEAWLQAGDAMYHSGEYAEAETFYQQATVLVPSNADVWLSFGTALQAQNKRSNAVAAYKRAIELKPDHVGAWSNLGGILKEQGNYDGAEPALQQALKLAPKHANAHYNFASLLILKGGERIAREHQAIQHYRQALELQPALLKAYQPLAELCRKHGDLTAAEILYKRACQLDPENAEFPVKLADILRHAERFEDAVACCRQALAKHGDLPKIHNMLGLCLQKNDPFQSIEHSQKALTLGYEGAEAYANIGKAWQLIGDSRQSVENLRKAYSLDPDNAKLYNSLIFEMNYQPDFSAQEVLAEHVAWGQKFADVLPRYSVYKNTLEPERKLRIGYVSPDFYQHATSRFIEHLLAGHNRDQFEVYCYANNLKKDEVTERLQSLADHWRSTVEYSNSQMAALIHQDNIDILIDLAGHTAHNRLLALAYKPAPIQIGYLGYHTSGIQAMDYWLTDSYADPPGETEQWYSEKLLRLPESRFCFSPPEKTPEVNSLPALKKDYITFGSFNAAIKISEETLSTWAKILQVVPNAKLIMISNGFSESYVVDRLQRFFKEQGIPPERLSLHGRKPLQEFLRLHHEVDIALDPLTYHGGTTTFYSLWMGVPVVSLKGNSIVTRGSVSILSNVGLPDLVAASKEEYVDVAKNLAGDIERLIDLRANLRRSLPNTPLMDKTRHVQQIEVLLRDTWRHWCKNTEAAERNKEQYQAAIAKGDLEDAATFYQKMLDFKGLDLSDKQVICGRVSKVADWCQHEGLPYQAMSENKDWQVPAVNILRTPEDIGKEAGYVGKIKEPEVYLAEVQDVSFIAASKVIVVNGNTILYDDAFHPMREIYAWRSQVVKELDQQQNIMTLILAKQTAEIVDEGILLSGNFTDNYFHWLMEFIASFCWLFKGSNAYSRLPLLVDEGLHDNLYEALQLLNMFQQPVIKLKKEQRYYIKKLIIPSKTAFMPMNYVTDTAATRADAWQDISFHAESILFLREKFLQAVCSEDSFSMPKKRLYLTRKSAKRRRLINEEEIERLFANYGFEIIETDAMTFREQVACFASAEFIAGPAGASMTNMLFAPTGCNVLIISPPSSPRYLFQGFGNILGHAVSFIEGFFKGNTNHAIAFHSDYFLDIDFVRNILDAYIEN